MTRPESYDENLPINRCATCKYFHDRIQTGGPVCLHGDDVVIDQRGEITEANGQVLHKLSVKQASQWIMDRAVTHDAVCDEWEERNRHDED